MLKEYKKVNKKELGIILGVLLLAGCDLPQKDIDDTQLNIPNKDLGRIEKYEDVFIQTAENTFELNTNQEEYLSEYGYTLWCEKHHNNIETFIPIKVEVEKQAGRTEGGYGIVFCATTESKKKNYLLTVMINNEQKYNIGKVKNGSFTTLSKGWQQCLYLNSGLNMKNIIEVQYVQNDEEKPEHNRKFEVKLNSVVVMYFNDPDVYRPIFTNTNYGYMAVITPHEDFKKSRVWVKFKDI